MEIRKAGIRPVVLAISPPPQKKTGFHAIKNIRILFGAYWFWWCPAAQMLTSFPVSLPHPLSEILNLTSANKQYSFTFANIPTPSLYFYYFILNITFEISSETEVNTDCATIRFDFNPSLFFSHSIQTAQSISTQ